MAGATVRRKVLLAWSSGKDAAWALHLLRRDAGVEVVGLLTTFNEAFGRVSMHGVRRELVARQASAAGIEPWLVALPHPCRDEQYEEIMARVVRRAREAGVDAMAFGDIALADVRAYRERQLAGSGVEPLFPLWGEDTAALAGRLGAAGLRARVTCLDPNVLAPSLAGTEWDAAFVAALPDGVDPCGENGEFHTFAYAGPMFAAPVAVAPGEVVTREGFVYADLLPR
jgi:uncharacterized protein (TIGR00290 family)